MLWTINASANKQKMLYTTLGKTMHVGTRHGPESMECRGSKVQSDPYVATIRYWWNGIPW